MQLQDNVEHDEQDNIQHNVQENMQHTGEDVNNHQSLNTRWTINNIKNFYYCPR